jgi:hypothetical protein
MITPGMRPATSSLAIETFAVRAKIMSVMLVGISMPMVPAVAISAAENALL